MPDISPTGRSNPLCIIVDSITAVTKSHGAEVSTNADIGVLCDSSVAPRWERDPRAAAVSPLGAVLLVHQPAISVVDVALSLALQISVGTASVYTAGFDDGCANVNPEGNSLSRGLSARVYGEGWEDGSTVRTLICTRVCTAHGIRYPRGGRCGSCAAGVPAPRADDRR